MASTLPDLMEPDEEIIERYTNGDCAVLALAIHEVTGWPMWALVETMERGTEGNYEQDWIHACVQVPDGRFLDITGLSDAQDLMSAWDNLYDQHAIDAGMDVFPSEEVADVRAIDDETRAWATYLVGLVG